MIIDEPWRNAQELFHLWFRLVKPHWKIFQNHGPHPFRTPAVCRSSYQSAPCRGAAWPPSPLYLVSLSASGGVSHRGLQSTRPSQSFRDLNSCWHSGKFTRCRVQSRSEGDALIDLCSHARVQTVDFNGAPHAEICSPRFSGTRGFGSYSWAFWTG
jgi:hypothetical protein